MHLKLELPEEIFLIKKEDLKVVLEEVLTDIKVNDKNNEIMTIKEAAEYLKVSIPTIRNMIANKEIPFFQRGQVIRLNRLDIKRWIYSKSKNEFQGLK
ncbi:helix-turn-helix domain-containing protein [Priestia megaterium]|uniref:helix-turn-helix domain-containing protein n=1 Tax=Priestia megaterium TaxID=1404 RepID=UPI0031705897